MIQLYDRDYDQDDLSVKISEMLVATADDADAAIDRAVPELLKLLRERLHMDVVFVSEFTGGKRVYRHVEAAANHEVIHEGESDPLEASFCQRVVDGRLPEMVKNTAEFKAAPLPAVPYPVGAYISTPIRMRDGSVYGTLCCFSFNANEELNHKDLKNLKLSAQLASRKIEEHSRRIQDLALVEREAHWSKPGPR